MKKIVAMRIVINREMTCDDSKPVEEHIETLRKQISEELLMSGDSPSEVDIEVVSVRDAG